MTNEQIKSAIEQEAERRNPDAEGATSTLRRYIDISRKHFIAGANYALSLDRWIKVEDELPELLQQVLCWSEFANMMYVASWDGDDWEEGFGKTVITPYAWQPLPEPPQQ